MTRYSRFGIKLTENFRIPSSTFCLNIKKKELSKQQLWVNSTFKWMVYVVKWYTFMCDQLTDGPQNLSSF